MEDAQIVDLFLAREEQAIAHSAEKYGRRLRALSFDIVKDAQTAEECENDTYQEAWESIPPHTPRDYLYAFLARILRHISLNRCRDRNRLKRSAHVCELSSEMEQCLPAPDDCACRMEEMALQEVLNTFLRGLPTKKRILFVRRYWYLDSIAEAARHCGISESKTKTELFRLRNALRDYLKKEGYVL